MLRYASPSVSKSLSSSLSRSSLLMSRNLSKSAPRMNHKYVADPSVGPMLQFQRSLPRLPVPTLESTAAKYLETVKPLVSNQQFQETKSLVEEFVKSDQAKDLQTRLLERAADPSRANWLADWWNDVAYMSYRDPVVVFVSYFYVHVDDPSQKTNVERAASLVKALLAFRGLVETQKLNPDELSGKPLCMASYKWLFNSSRYPTKPADTAKKFDPSENNHVIFIRKNKFYEVPVVYDGAFLSVQELESQIARVITMANMSEDVPAVGALTSDNRDHWTDARQHLISVSPLNAQSLERIESAIIVVPLDDSAPKTREQISWACWTGDGRNRFYDKHQLIVFENGKSGFLGEHSCMDGTPTLRMNEFMIGALKHGKVDPGNDVSRPRLPSPRELKFEIDDISMKNITDAESRFEKLISEHDLQVLHFSDYGKEIIKKYKVSPDAWAQLVKQLAFHKMFNRPGVCYESAQTRKYQLGRTEVIRSASSESKEWAEAMLNPSETDVRRATLFKRAVGRHRQYAAWAADGQGVDRHLFGLKKLLKPGERVPALYEDKSFSASNHWELSTSNLSSESLDGWGYGEVVPDGYGLSYSIGDHYIRWTITSLKQRTEEFKDHLAAAAKEVKEMMDRAIEEESRSNLDTTKSKL